MVIDEFTVYNYAEHELVIFLYEVLLLPLYYVFDSVQHKTV